MNTNTLKKIFPEPINHNYNELKIDLEGLWSITHPKDANTISNTINSLLNIDPSDIKILDMTAGCGGNMISFIQHSYNVTGIEINKDRYEILKNNLSKYTNLENYTLLYDDCINIIKKNTDYNVYFIDPPWGGPEYKKNEMIELYLSNINLKDIILMIPKNKLIVLKLPYNYNTDYFKDSPLDYNIIKKIILNNIIILFISMIE
jgi:predicted RNA methylase